MRQVSIFSLPPVVEAVSRRVIGVGIGSYAASFMMSGGSDDGGMASVSSAMIDKSRKACIGRRGDYV